ncbi:type VI secretion system-associated protein TagO [Jannaschia donghaensis]|nr:type VI secretion system-associated protein TagO [Jannaschia donghaensis]
MRFPFRLVAFLGAASSGATIGYSLADRPPAPIVLTQADDVVLPDVPVIPVETPVPRADPWTLRQEAAVFDDLTNVYLSVPSDAPLACGPRRRASLLLRCLEDRTAVYIAHDCATPAGDLDGWSVDLRLDDHPVEQMWMQVDSRGEAFGLWDYQQARVFIERLLMSDTLHLRFAEAGGLISEMAFPVSDLTGHVDVLTQACNWSDVPPWEIGPQPLDRAEPEPVKIAGQVGARTVR